LLFVGVTRAKRALLVSYATSKSGAAGRRREITPLLVRWRDRFGVPTELWEGEAAVKEQVSMPAVWGGAAGASLAARSLDSGTCSIQTYVEDVFGARFPTLLRPLYPIFVARIRQALRRIVAEVHAVGRVLSEDESSAIFDGAWPEDEFRDHPHVGVYRPRAERAVLHFARSYRPEPEDVELLEVELLMMRVEGAVPIRLDLVAHYRRANGSVVAMLLHVPSLANSVGKDGGVLWSKLSSARRLPFVLLREQHTGFEPHLYSLADSAVYSFQWSKKGDSMDREAAAAMERLASITTGMFATEVNEWRCDRCTSRIGCPHWIGMIPD
jgi:hypothetical protein